MIIISGSLLYTEFNKNRFVGYPLIGNLKDSPLQIYYFFPGLNCDTCIESIEYLNNLSESIPVTGVLCSNKPDTYLIKEVGIKFPITSISALGLKYKPGFVPSIVGILNNGTVMFIQSGIPDFSRSNTLIFDSLNTAKKIKQF